MEQKERKKYKQRHIVKDTAGRPWPDIPLEDRKIMVYCTVKRRHWNTAMKAIKELCKQWR